MYNEEDRKWLYDKMKSSGVDTGNYDDFKNSLNNDEDREWYYNKSIELGLDVGSPKDFDDMMLEKKPTPAKPQEQKGTTPASPETPTQQERRVVSNNKGEYGLAADKPVETSSSLVDKARNYLQENVAREGAAVGTTLGRNVDSKLTPEAEQAMQQAVQENERDYPTGQVNEGGGINLPGVVVMRQRTGSPSLYENPEATTPNDYTLAGRSYRMSWYNDSQGKTGEEMLPKYGTEATKEMLGDRIKERNTQISKLQSDMQGNINDDTVAKINELKAANVRDKNELDKINNYSSETSLKTAVKELSPTEKIAYDKFMDIFHKKIDELDKAGEAKRLEIYRTYENMMGNPGTGLGVVMQAERLGNKASDPMQAINAVLDKLWEKRNGEARTQEQMAAQEDWRSKIGMMLVQAMQQELVKKRMPKNAAEYILGGLSESDFGQIVSSITKSDYQRYLDQLANAAYDSNMLERVLRGGVTFAGDMWEFAAAGKLANIATRGMRKRFVRNMTDELIARGVEKKTAKGIAERLLAQSTGKKAVLEGAQSGTMGAIQGAGSAAIEAQTQNFGDVQAYIAERRAQGENISKEEEQRLMQEAADERKSFPATIEQATKQGLWTAAIFGSFPFGGIVGKVFGKKVAGNAGGVAQKIVEQGTRLVTNAGIATGFHLAEQAAEGEVPADAKGKDQSVLEMWLENTLNFALLELPGFAKRLGNYKNIQAFEKAYNFTDADKKVLSDAGYGSVYESVIAAAKKEKPSVAYKGEGYEQLDVEEVNEGMKRMMEDPNLPETTKRKVYAMVTGDYAKKLSPVVSHSISKNGNKYVLERYNQNGDVVSREEFRTYDAAEGEADKYEFQEDLNHTAALENSLQQHEAEHLLKQMYDEAIEKDTNKRTEEDKLIITLYRYKDEVGQLLLKKQTGGELTQNEESLIQKFQHVVGTLREQSNVVEAVKKELEEEMNLSSGDIEAAMLGHSKKEVKEDDNPIKLGNVYRTGNEHVVVQEYRKLLLERLNRLSPEDYPTYDESSQPLLEERRGADAAYSKGYDTTDEEGMQDAKYAVESARERLISETDEQTAKDLDDDPFGTLRRLSPTLWTRALDYINAKAAYDGMIQRVRDGIDSQVEESNNTINQRTNKADGQLHPADTKYFGKVFIVDGQVTMLPDGTMVDKEKSDQDIIVIDEQGKTRFIPAEDILSVDEPINAEEESQRLAEEIRQSVAQEAADKIDGTLPFRQGDTYEVTDEEGTQHTVQVVQDMGDGTVTAVVDGGLVAALVSKEQIQAWADNAARIRREQKEAEVTTEQPQGETPVEETSATTETETPVEEEAPAETTTKEAPVTPENDIQPTEESHQEPMPMVEVKGKQKPDWSNASPTRAHTYIYNERGLSRENANAFVENNRKAAEDELKKLQKKQPKMGTDLDEFDEKNAAWQQQVDAVQQRMDYWSAVKQEQDKIAAAEQAERAEREQQTLAEARAQEQQRQQEELAKQAEQEALGSNKPSPAITEKWQKARKIYGRSETIVLPNGERVKGKWVLHESGASTPSHNPFTWEPTEGFPEDKYGNTTNDRDYRGDKDAQKHVVNISRNLDKRAWQTPVMVTEEDGITMSGNGRTEARELAAANGTDKQYIADLKEEAGKFNFTEEDVNSFEHPTLSFEIEGKMPYTTETFAKFNQQEMKGQSKTEQAVKLGKVVDDSTFNRIVRSINNFDTLGEFYADTNAATEAISELQKIGVISPAQYTEMFDGDTISEAGRQMLENMLIGKAFESNPDAVRQLTEVKSLRQNVVNALADVSSNLQLGEDYNLESELAQAIELAYRARKSGFKSGDKVSGFARQQNLFQFDEGATVADYTNMTILMLADAINGSYRDAKGKLISFKKILSHYNNQAADSAAGQADIFSGGVKTKEDILKEVLEILGYGTEQEKQAGNTTAVEQPRSSESAQQDGATPAGNTDGEATDTGVSNNDGRAEDGGRDTDVRRRTANDTTNGELEEIGHTVGPFGEIYRQFKGKPKEAVSFLLAKRGGEAIGALHHKEIGDIDLVWGDEGTGHSDGYGLAKLAKYHPEVLFNLQEILNDMVVTKRSANRAQLESDKYQAAVRLTWDEKKKTWLLTMFEKKNSALDNTTDTGKTLTDNGNDTATPGSTVVSDGKDSNNSSIVQEKDEKKETTVSPELKSLIDDYNATDEKYTEYIKLSGEERNKTEKEREEAFRAWIDAKTKLREALNNASQEELEYLKSNGSREVRDMALKEQSNREAKLDVSETFDERIKEQEEITGKGSIKPLSKATVDIAEKNEQRPVMGGVYHDPEGYGVVSDGHTLVASKELYDKKNKGKIIAVHELKSSGAKKGEEIKGKYPKWRMVIPKEVGKTAAVDWQHLSNFLAGVTAEMKKRWQEAKEEGRKESFATFNDSTRIALRMPDGTIVAFRADSLAKFINAAQQLEAKEIEYTFEDRAIVARGKKGIVLQMPVSSPYDVIHEDNVFFYDSFKEGKGVNNNIRFEKASDAGLHLSEKERQLGEVLDGVLEDILGDDYSTDWVEGQRVLDADRERRARLMGNRAERRKTDIPEKDKQETEKIFDTAKEKFGTTYDIREAGYILPDGTMLDFSGKHELDAGTDTSFLNGQRSTDHREISKIAYDRDAEGNEVETGIKTDMPDFIERGAIRIDSNAGTINLSQVPTDAQKGVLRRLISRNDGYVSVDFGNGWDSDHYVEYDGAKALRVLSDIDKYFNEGIRPQGDFIADAKYQKVAPVFYSNAEHAVEGIKQEKATPEQWLKMIEKAGGMKAGEDKWLGLSDWLKGQDKKSLTKQEVLDYIRENQVQVEEVNYAERREFNDKGEVISDAPIDSTRLRYTTEGLDNKREIALTVPTIEPYNESDNIHFGDAGEGRAVAWIRFGETTDADGKRVLVIDEIQSKRHQEGRENGYAVSEEKAAREMNAFLSKMKDKYHYDPQTPFNEIFNDNELKELQRLNQQQYDASFNRSAIPDAPFEKNWHELAMKRMLRYAAENGYDKVAWTTGEQQAERYNIGNVVSKISVFPDKEFGGRQVIIRTNINDFIDLDVDDKGIVENGEYRGKPLSDVLGKDLATKIIADTENSVYEGDRLRIGSDGMKGFYDQMLPRFMDKYGKKWGVKVGEVELPNLEKNAQHMWSIDVTPEMKKSVTEGQPMFFRTETGEAYGFTLNGKIYVDPRIATSETRVHEYAHLWAQALRKGNPKEWQNVITLMKGTSIWDEVKERYPELRTDDDVAEEVLAHYSGRRGAERLRAAQEEALRNAKGVIEKAQILSAFDKVKQAIKRFWKAFADFLHIHYTSAEEVADRVMADLLDRVNPKEMLRKQQENPHKAAQLDIVTKENPMQDDYHTGIRSIDDIRTFEEAVKEGEGIDSYPDYTKADAEKALSSGKITVYSSKPIRNGAFVSASRMEAKDYAGGGKVYSKEVPLEDVAWIYANEGQYAKVEGEPDTEARTVETENEENNIRFHFIGEQGARGADMREEQTHRIDNLDVARSMEEAGKDAKAIKMATGWERGGDGKWRYEIEDADKKTLVRAMRATISKGRNAIAEAEGQADAYRQKAWALDDRIPKRLGSKYSEEEKERYRKMRNERNRLYDEANKAIVRRNELQDAVEKEGYKTTLGEVLKGSEILKAYPSLAEIEVRIRENMRGAVGSYNHEKKTLDVMAKDVSIDNVYSTTMHEIQHAIQSIEGFARGGNLGSILKDREAVASLQEGFRNSIESKRKEQEEIRKILAERSPEIWDEAHKNNVDLPEQIRKYEVEVNWLEAEINHLERLSKDLENGSINADVAEEYYRRLGGEVESRNVQRRIGMTPEERRRSLASETEDVSRKDQKFLFGEEEDNNLSLQTEKTNGNAFSLGGNSISLHSERDVEAVRGQRERFSPTAPWRDGVEDVMVHTTLGTLRGKHVELYNKAKAGDVEAAEELVSKVVKPEKVKALAEAHPEAMVVPVHAEEALGRNKIPAVYAKQFEKYGLAVVSDIRQINKPFHTGSDRVGRFIRRARFNGEVKAGKEYILVDDHITMGSTLRDLKDYIEGKGGKVVAISTLTASAGGTKLRPTEQQKQQLKERGVTNEQLKELGIADSADGLTRREVQEILVLANTRGVRGSSQRFERDSDTGANSNLTNNTQEQPELTGGAADEATIVALSHLNADGYNESDPLGKKLSDLKKEAGRNSLVGYTDSKSGDYVFFGNDTAVVKNILKPTNYQEGTQNGMPMVRVAKDNFDKLSLAAVRDGLRVAITKDTPNTPTSETKRRQTGRTGKPKMVSMTEGNLFGDEDFEEKPQEIGQAETPEQQARQMTDEGLLEEIAKGVSQDGWNYHIEEYDRRHNKEYLDGIDNYTEMLEREATDLDDAYGMYAEVSKRWKDGGYGNEERTALRSQMDALEDYIQKKEAERMEEEDDLALLEDTATAEQQAEHEKQKEEVRAVGYDLTQLKMRELEEDEECHVERQYVNNGFFSFTGGEHIESAADVAYLFRQLEDSSVENSFMVLIKDGIPTVIHLGIGNYASTVAPLEQALVAFKELNPDKVVFLHNHPSGNLKPSQQDFQIADKVQKIFGKVAAPSIIIDTKSGKYAMFEEGVSFTYDRPTQVDNEVPVKVFNFSKQVFDKDWNPETAFKALGSESVAAYVSSHRLGEHKKMSLLVLDQAGHITGNVFLPWTKMEDAAKRDNLGVIATYVNQMGGTSVILYGSYESRSRSESSIMLQSIKDTLKADYNIHMMDAMSTSGMSAYEHGLIWEPETEYSGQAKNVSNEDSNDVAEDTARYRIREDEPPTKTGIGYKVFVLKDGKLYPPMVANPNGEATPVGVWLDADAAPVAGVTKTGRQQVKAGGKGTQGGSGKLAYRPGWHLGEIPYALQFNRINPETGQRELFPANFVWAEVEYADDVDYNEEARSYGMNANGKYQHSLAGLPRVPENGSYKYRTNPDPNTDPWIITGAMRVKRVLTPSEVDQIVEDAGREPQERQAGAVTDEQVNALNAEIERTMQEDADMKRTTAEQMGEELNIKLNVIEDVDDITHPNAEVQERRRRSKGWYDTATGEVYIVLPNNADVDDVKATIGHETVAHKGLRELIGEERYNDFLDETYSHLRDDLKQQVDDEAGKMFLSAINNNQAGRTYEECRRTAVDEMFGRLAEKPFEEFSEGERTLWQKIKAAVRRLLDKFLGSLKLPKSFVLGDNELRYILWRSKERLERGREHPIDLARDIVKREELGLDANENADLYREDGEAEEYDAGRKSLSESLTEGLIALANKNRDNLTLRINAMRAIGGNLSKLRQAMARQREYDKETVNNIVRWARVLMNAGYGGEMTKGEVSRLIGMIGQAAAREDITKQANAIMDLMITHNLRACKEILSKQLRVKGSKLNSSGVEIQAGLDIEGQRMVGAFKDGMALTEDALATRIEDTLDRMGSSDKVIADNAAADYQGLLLAQQYLENIKNSEVEEKTLKQELKTAKEDYKAGNLSRQEYKEYVASIENALRENKLDRIEAYGQLVSAMGDGMRESVERAKEWREREKERVNEIHHNANSDLNGVSTSENEKLSWWQKANNWSVVRFFAKPLATFDSMLRYFGSKSVDGRGYLFNRFMGGWIKAADREWRNLRAAHEELDDKVSEVMGKEMRWSDLFDMERKMPTVPVEIWDAGEKRNVELTQGNLLYIYMVNKMSDGKMKLRRMGITEEDVDYITEQIDPRFKEIADWVQEEFLTKKREEYNKVYERMFGSSMAAIDNYFPLKINSRSRGQEEDIGSASYAEDKPATITGSVIKRTRNSLPLDLLGADAFDVVLEHLQDMEHWAAFAEFSRDLNTLLSYRRFKNRVLNMSSTRYGAGEILWKNFKDVCAIAAGTYQPIANRNSLDKAAVNVAKGVTAAKISLRIYTALKQLLSYPAYFSEASVLEMAKSTNPIGAVKAWNWAIEELPGFAERWESRQAGDSRLKETDSDWSVWKNKIVEIASRWGMSPNAFVDGLTVAMGAKAIYETKMKQYKKMGYPAEKAKEKALQDASMAFNETQQSSGNAYLSAMQVDRTLGSVALTVFRNASMGYQRRMAQALSNLRNKMRPGYRQQTIEFMKKEMVRDGLTEEQAEENAKRMYNHSWFKDIADTIIFGFVLQAAWNLGPYLPYLLAGDDDDEKDSMLSDALWHALAGGIEGLSGGNLMSDLYNNARNGTGWRNFNLNLLPLMSDIQNTVRKFDNNAVAGWNEVFNIIIQSGVGVNPQTITDAMVAIMDYTNGNPEEGREIAMLMMRLLQIPQSSLDKLYIDELQMNARDAKKLDVQTLAKRYIDYKRKKEAPLTDWAYSDEMRQKVDDKYSKRFENLLKERIEQFDDEKLEQYYNTTDPVLKKSIGKEVAKRMGGTDSYGNPSTDYGDTYLRMRDYIDLAEDILLQSEGAKAEQAGDTERAEDISAARNAITAIKKELAEATSEEERQQIMQDLREERKTWLNDLNITHVNK